jgi:hypothetical protein
MSRFEQGGDLAGQEMYGGMGESGELCWLCVTHSTRSDLKLAAVRGVALFANGVLKGNPWCVKPWKPWVSLEKLLNQ